MIRQPAFVRMVSALLVAGFALAALPAVCDAANSATSWDHLVRVRTKRFDEVYVRPNSDFRGYTKILMDPVQVAFRKNWQRDMNNASRNLSRRVSDDDAAKLAERTRTGATRIFTDAFKKAGYEFVTEPGPDVLRVSPAVIDLYISAPDTMSAGRSRTYTVDAGEATLNLEARDSLSGELLGRAVDRQRAGGLGGNTLSLSSSVTNDADFERLYSRWADRSVKGLAALKEQSPVAPPTGSTPAAGDDQR